MEFSTSITDILKLHRSILTDLQKRLGSSQGSITLTTSGSSGASTLIGNSLNIPVYSGGGTTSWGSITGTLTSQTDLNTALLAKVTGNASITGATKTKITYDSKGLVTSGADATTADIADSLNKRYVTDAQQTIIGNTSGTNTGDNATNSQYSGLAASKQDTLVSGTNIKTINSTTLLGSGNITTGSVTSVGVSMPTAFTVTNSPIISSGTIAITGAGTTLEYIRGDGTLSTFPSLTGYVPYTGATTNVDLGEFELKAGQLTLDTTPTGTAAVTTTRWNDSLGSTETTLKGGSVVLKNGVDLVARVVNKVTPNQTLTKTNYPVVRISGAQGQRLAIDLAQANNDNNSADTLGVVTETILTNQEGFIITMGQIEEINTTGSLQSEVWADGDVLYLSPTVAGKLTNVKPTGATGHIVIIGYVEHAHAIHGKIYIKVMNGWELDELHNVYINTPLNNDVLAYETSTLLWKNKSISNLLGFTPISLTSLSSSATGITYTNTTGVFSLTSGYVIPTTSSASNWDSAYTNRITSLTTSGSSGSSTLTSNTLNIPTYTLAGLGGVPTTRTLTINGTALDLSANRSWTVGTVNSVATGTGLTGGTITGSGTISFSTAAVGTWAATPSSANLAAAMTDETGSGSLVFGTSPTFTNSITVNGSTISGYNTTPLEGAIKDGVTSILGDLSTWTTGCYQGTVLYSETSSTTIAFGQLCYRTNAGQWGLADATSLAASAYYMLGICLKTTTGPSQPTSILINGFVESTYVADFKVGEPQYMATTAGSMTKSAPASSGNIVRIIGNTFWTTALQTNAKCVLHFNPDKTWIELT